MHKSSRFALPLITRPAKHSGVTFGAATSVLLTGVGETFGVRRYRESLTLVPSPKGRGRAKRCRNPVGGGQAWRQTSSGLDLQN